MTPEHAIANLTRRGLLHVADHVSAASGVPLSLLLGRKRCKSVAAARRLLYTALRSEGLSLPEIGALLDRDHTTVLDGLRPLASAKRAAEARALSDALSEALVGAVA